MRFLLLGTVFLKARLFFALFLLVEGKFWGFSLMVLLRSVGSGRLMVGWLGIKDLLLIGGF
jgi:hypothetical protein